MIKVSDNTSLNALLNEFDAIKKDPFEKVEKDLRLRKTEIHDEQAFKKYS